MKIALAQIDPTIGDLEGNFKKIVAYSERARERGAEVVIFPELALSGYPPLDIVERSQFIFKNWEYIKKLCSVLKIDAIFGAITPNENETGRKVFNSAVYISKGEIKEIVNKWLLPTYDIFDEARWFEPSTTVKSILLNNRYKIAITICEDIWADPKLWERPIYKQDPISELIKTQKVDFIINISASPFTIRKPLLRYNAALSTAKKAHAPVILVNQVGGNDELIFDGGSFVVTPRGDIVAQAYSFKEDLIIFDLESMKGEIREEEIEDEIDKVREAIKLGIKDFLNKCGFNKAVLGLSGGIDSSVVAVLAAEALGNENVWGVSMPSRFSSESSIKDAERLAKNLGIKFSIVPIEDMFKSGLSSLEPIFKDLPFSTAEENLQARLRGMIIMALSNKFGYFPLATGNKSEFAVGYSTLYGDMCGGLAPLGDVPKTMVYKLAKRINKDKEIIPSSILIKPPSAELRPDQKDEDILPPYHILDQIIFYYVERNKSIEDIIALGFERETVERTVKMITASEYKRRQAPPILKITDKSFGIGRKYPIAQKYRL